MRLGRCQAKTRVTLRVSPGSRVTEAQTAPCAACEATGRCGKVPEAAKLGQMSAARLSPVAKETSTSGSAAAMVNPPVADAGSWKAADGSAS